MAAKAGWTGAEWHALDEVVSGESGWESCRRYPSITECTYRGSNSCGIPQATPCPAEWQGRLDTTWRAQIRWLLQYVRRRYGDPINALQYHLAHNSY